jgi:hypothetical protein
MFVTALHPIKKKPEVQSTPETYRTKNSFSRFLKSVLELSSQ